MPALQLPMVVLCYCYYVNVTIIYLLLWCGGPLLSATPLTGHSSAAGSVDSAQSLISYPFCTNTHPQLYSFLPRLYIYITTCHSQFTFVT